MTNPDDGVPTTSSDLRAMRSASLAEAGVRDHYQARWFGDILVEQVTCRPDPPLRHLAGTAISGTGYTWVRFWLPGPQTVVESYYDAEQTLIGTLVYVTMPLLRHKDAYTTEDLLLGIWVTPAGRVVVLNETSFEAAVYQGDLSVGEAKRAEYQVRDLTSSIARGEFPPPFVATYRPLGEGDA